MKKNQLPLTVCLSLCAIIVSGCASSMMVKTQPVELNDKNMAMVTFLRPTIFGGAIQFGIWDGDKFVGVLSANSYIQYMTSPGQHYFLGRAENWSCIRANLEAGKRYYILGRVFPGIWKARIAFDPIRSEDQPQSQVDEWMNRLAPMSVDESKRNDYVQPRIEQVRKRVREFESGNGICEIMCPSDGR